MNADANMNDVKGKASTSEGPRLKYETLLDIGQKYIPYLVCRCNIDQFMNVPAMISSGIFMDENHVEG
jgi:hypothetical protein